MAGVRSRVSTLLKFFTVLQTMLHVQGEAVPRRMLWGSVMWGIHLHRLVSCVSLCSVIAGWYHCCCNCHCHYLSTLQSRTLPRWASWRSDQMSALHWKKLSVCSCITAYTVRVSVKYFTILVPAAHFHNSPVRVLWSLPIKWNVLISVRSIMLITQLYYFIGWLTEELLLCPTRFPSPPEIV